MWKIWHILWYYVYEVHIIPAHSFCADPKKSSAEISRRRHAGRHGIWAYHTDLEMEDVMYQKIMIASDIHGSAYYCRRMLEQYRREEAEMLVLLGDILYHGPRNDLPREYAPKEVIEMLNPLRNEIMCVRGNCDTEVDQMVLDFNVLCEQGCLYINGRRLIIAHGHKLDEKNMPPVCEGDYLLCGHTHVPTCEKRGFYTYLNPGSVSIPKENSANSYMILSDRFYWKSLDGSVFMTAE